MTIFVKKFFNDQSCEPLNLSKNLLVLYPDARILLGILCPIGFYTHVTRRHRQMKTWALEHEYFCLYRIQETKHCIK